MANLAIRGHTTHGKEIIEILEMLGGINGYGISITNSDLLYTIRSHDDFIISVYPSNTFMIFTLEEFLEKYPYRIGDKVKTIYRKIGIVSKLIWSDRNNCIRYELKDTDGFYFINELQPYKETPMYLNEKANKQAEEIAEILEPVKEIMEEMKLDIPDGYEFFGIDDDNKIVLTKKQHQYPKTYVECCKIVGAESNRHYQYTKKDKEIDYPHEVKLLDCLDNLRRLLICRNAYWKIVGEQMGLDKPWEPDWEDDNVKYSIFSIKGIPRKVTSCYDNSILAFPSEEVRDAFYENFKELIEPVKELL